MGRVNKLLAEIDGVPMIYRAVETALRSNAAEVVVVSGHQADPLRRALSGLEPRFIHNSSYRQGLATSLMSGIGAVSPSIAGAVVLLGDMPRLSADTVNALIARFFADHGKNICRPVFGGRPGNPVLWPRAWFSEILDIRGDIGARRLLERDDAQASSVEVDAPGIHFDIDEPQDLASLQATTA